MSGGFFFAFSKKVQKYYLSLFRPALFYLKGGGKPFGKKSKIGGVCGNLSDGK